LGFRQHKSDAVVGQPRRLRAHVHEVTEGFKRFLDLMGRWFQDIESVAGELSVVEGQEVLEQPFGDGAKGLDCEFLERLSPIEGMEHRGDLLKGARALCWLREPRPAEILTGGSPGTLSEELQSFFSLALMDQGFA